MQHLQYTGNRNCIIIIVWTDTISDLICIKSQTCLILTWVIGALGQCYGPCADSIVVCLFWPPLQVTPPPAAVSYLHQKLVIGAWSLLVIGLAPVGPSAAGELCVYVCVLEFIVK